jgi:hypothetical protein
VTMLDILFAPTGGGAQTGYLYQTWITAPTGNSAPPSTWENVYIGCGWHTDCLEPGLSDGSNIDWGWTSSQGYKVFFRGAFKRSNTSYEASHLRAVAELGASTGTDCDWFTTRVDEKYGSPPNWHYRWAMGYVHANRRSSLDIFAIGTTGDPTGWWNGRWVGNMVDDSVGCNWTAHHVHDTAITDHSFPKALSGWLENRPPIQGSIPVLAEVNGWCNCGWSRYFVWAEAYP